MFITLKLNIFDYGFSKKVSTVFLLQKKNTPRSYQNYTVFKLGKRFYLLNVRSFEITLAVPLIAK